MDITYLEHNPYLQKLLNELTKDSFSLEEAEVVLSVGRYVDTVQVDAEFANVKEDEDPRIFARSETAKEEEDEILELYRKFTRKKE